MLHTVKKKLFIRLVLLITLLQVLVLIDGYGLSFRAEMVTKISIISLLFMTIPLIDFGAARRFLILGTGILIIAASAVIPDSKAFARTATIIALVFLSFRTSHKLFLGAIVIIPLWLIQEDIGSRTLLAVVGLFGAQLVLLRFFHRPVLIWLFVLVYPIGLFALGYAFIFGNGLIDASASNLGRSTIIHTVLDSVWDFPFGYPDTGTYEDQLALHAQKLFSSEYNDPHNLLMSAIVWGGLPLAFIVIYSLYIGAYRALAGDCSSPVTLFAASALAVMVSTQTLSFVNVLFFLFLSLHLSPRKSPSID